MKAHIQGLIALGFLIIVLSMAACDKAKFEQDHPVETEVLEAVEPMIEVATDTALHMPPGTSHIIEQSIEHDID